MFGDPRSRDPRRRPPRRSAGGGPFDPRQPVLLPPTRPTGSLFARRRREILAMLGGAVAAVGLWLFVGGPESASLGRFSSPGDGADERPEGGRIAMAADSSAATALGDSATGGDVAPGPDSAATDPGGAQGARPDAGGRTALANVEPRVDAAPVSRGATDPRTDPARDAGDTPPARGDPPSEDPAASRVTPAPARRAPPPAPPPARERAPDADPGGEEAVPATPVEARVAAEVAISRYARAIEAGDLQALRRAHPGLSAEREAAWRRVFENGETFVAMLRIDGFGVTDTEARARVRGSCHFYDLSLRRFVDVPVEFELFLHHDGRTWRPVLASGATPDPEP